MKKLTLPLLVLTLLFGGGACATAEEKPFWSRTLTQFGVLETLGGNDWSRQGWGVSIRPYFYLDPAAPDGLYLGFLSGALSHSAAQIVLADTRMVTLGWRGNPLSLLGKPPLDFQADFSVSPTLGARISGDSILGHSYGGLGFTLGLYFPVFDWGDLGFSWEPTINLATWGGQDIPEKSYTDFVVYWTLKFYSQNIRQPWK